MRALIVEKSIICYYKKRNSRVLIGLATMVYEPLHPVLNRKSLVRHHPVVCYKMKLARLWAFSGRFFFLYNNY